MKFRIGIDFDNTIACYDHVFSEIAQLQKLVLGDDIFTKAHIKQLILANEEGDVNWQRLQGQIYGKYMHRALAFPGFAEFLYLAKLRGHEVFIVSHKSEFGHFDPDKVHLPTEAMKWLIANGFVESGSSLQKNDVFFAPTRELKIKKIIELGCTHFIDDLQEVFDEVSFPEVTNKYLFNPAVSSWRLLTKEILGEWTDHDIYLSTQFLFPELEIQNVELIKGRGNSRIYKLSSAEISYALKIYPDRQLDNRKRLEAEFSACQFLSEAGFPVVSAVAKNSNMNWAIYSWIQGDIEIPNKQFISTSVDFVKHLQTFSHSSQKAESFINASEACLSGSEIVRQIKYRLNRLHQVNLSSLKNFLDQEFLPVFDSLVKLAKDYMKGEFNKPLDDKMLILSPSDFGSHNAIKDKSGKTFFIDFEYFGWDDPVKLASDFYWHPAMNLAEPLQMEWIKKIKAIFTEDLNFNKRLSAYLPLMGLRWCLILLNEFLPDKLAHRIHADKDKIYQKNDIQASQLKKARLILTEIKNNKTLWISAQTI